MASPSDDNNPPGGSEPGPESAGGSTSPYENQSRNDLWGRLSASLESLSDTFSGLLGRGRPTPSVQGEASNDQPTQYNVTAIAALIVGVTLVVSVVYFVVPVLFSGGGTPDQQTQTDQQESTAPTAEQRSEYPGVEDPSQQFANPDQREGPSRNNGPQNRSQNPFGQGPSGNTPQDNAPNAPLNTTPENSNPDTPPGAPQTGPSNTPSDRRPDVDADPSNPERYARELSEAYRKRNQAQSQDNPYADGANRSPSRDMDKVNEAMSSGISVETSPPGNFDPNKAGIPRDPASGRPLGSSPTPEEGQKEAQYEQESSQRNQEEARQQEQSATQQMREKFPTKSPEDLSENEEYLVRQEVRGGGKADVNSVQGPFSAYVIPKGTIIPIVLESGAKNSLPGNTIMRTTRDVYDRTMRHVLIPRGSEIVSNYSTATEVGQTRLLVTANRLNLPDGRYVEFEDARATDGQGFAGLKDQVDRNLLRRFGAAGGLAVLGAVVNASNPLSFLAGAQQDSSGVVAGGGVAGGGGGFQNRFGTSLSQQVNNIIGQLLEKQVDRKPEITLRPGVRGLLVLNEDIDMQRPYYEPGGDFEQMDNQYREYRLEKIQRQTQRRLERLRQREQSRQRAEEARKRYNKIRKQSGAQVRQDQEIRRTPSGEPKYYIGRLRAENRQGSTMLPPRRGPTARERYIYGPNYHRGVNVPPSKRDSTVPASTRRALKNAPDGLKPYRRAKIRENPTQYYEPDRPLYDRRRSDNRYTRGKESYRPRNSVGSKTPQQLNRKPPPPDTL